jgi:HK97 family phage prohead protease
MEHLLLKAATTATTDQGVFEAVISTPSVDRDKDIVEPQAMVDALQKWAALGKLVPLAWAHTEDVVGNVDPATVRVENAEVIVAGQIDQTTELGMEAWRLVKSGTLSFSFGYLIPDGGATKRPGGGLNIKELDLFEISVVPVGPANNDTRILSFKTADELRKESDRLEREIAEAQIPDIPPAPVVPAAEEPDVLKELQEVKARLATAETALETLSKKAEEMDKDRKAPSMDPLRKRSEELALEVASDGMSLRRPPAKEAPTPPDLTNLRELKQQSRDLMDLLLSDTME